MMINLDFLLEMKRGLLATRGPLFVLLILVCAHNNVLSGVKSTYYQQAMRRSLSVQDPGQMTRLEPGRMLSREIEAGQKHAYLRPLTTGQYLGLFVNQQGIDVAITIMNPSGDLVGEFDSEIRGHGQEEISQVARATGDYKITIQAKPKPKASGRYEIQITELRDATSRETALQEARDLNAEFRQFYAGRQLKQAREKIERALEIRRRELGAEHPDVAASLNNLALVARDAGDLDEAEKVNRQALEIRKKALGQDHPSVASSMLNLGIVYNIKGDYSQARSLIEDAVTIWKKWLPEDHLMLASAYEGLGIVYREMGDYTRSEENHLRALRVKEENLGLEHRDVGATLSNLGIVYRRKGDYTKAEQTYLRALAIFETSVGKENVFVANVLNNLGLVYNDWREFDKAEEFHNRAWAMRKKVLDPEHPDVAMSFHNLGVVNHNRGNEAEAERLYQSAINIWEKRLGLGHPLLAGPLVDLGLINLARSHYAEAEKQVERALSIREESLGPWHPDVGFCLDVLADIYVADGKIPLAISSQSRATQIHNRNLMLNLNTGSERQKLAYLELLSEEMDHVISLHARYAPNDPAARDLAFNAIIERKGRVLDAVAETFSALHSRADVQTKALLDQLMETRSRLTRLVYAGPRTTLDEHQKQIGALYADAERLETELNRRSAEFRATSQEINVAAIQANIPDKAALVEFFLYRPFQPVPGKSAQTAGEPFYIAYILRRQGPVQWVEIGKASLIDGLITSWRTELSRPKQVNNVAYVKRLGRAVEDRVMRKVLQLLPGVTQILISPDGQLNLIPFAALVDEKGKYLVEGYSLTYLTSARDLLRLSVHSESKSAPILMGDPAYGDPLDSPPRAERRSSTDSRDPLANIYFGPLLTGDEVTQIQKIVPQAKPLMKKDATEAAVKGATSPRLLHIATHGFFLPDPNLKAGSNSLSRPVPSLSDLLSGGGGSSLSNPLLRSGLALAGANQRKSGEDDGILTALEMTGIDLWGTELVVLSACDTGLGQVKNGEGVYGLRRALVLAGSESQVVSLWKVKDDRTRDLMVDYYTELLNKKAGRGEALRTAQLHRIKQHPYFWASFIQSGEWANLEGQR